MALIRPQIAALRQRVLDTIRQHGLCSRNDTLIVAVSGGADSVALLDLLANLPDFPLSLVVAHLNHCLRGEASNKDEQFVRTLAAAYNLPLEVRRADVRKEAEEQRLSVEEAGREARYAFFQELRQRHRATAIVTAHHADDQAETLLIRLLRGSGADGLGCMPYCSNRGIIRPLLDTDKTGLRRYLEEQGITWQEDASNQDRSFLRNRIRHELLPLLTAYSPAVARRLAATAELLQLDQELLGHHVAETFNRLAQQTKDCILLPDTCSSETSGMRYRLYRLAIETIAGNLRRFGLEHIRQVDHLLLEGSTGATLPLPQNLAATRTPDGLLISTRTALSCRCPTETTINGPGSYDLSNGLTLFVQRLPCPPENHAASANAILVDLSAAPFPWLARPHRPGDRIALAAGSGNRGTGRILIDLKIPRHLRSMLPLLLSGNQPLWLVGAKRSGHALISPMTTDVAKVSVSGLDNLLSFPALP